MDCLTLKKANCKNCYKCIRHCPVKAIRFSGNQAHIIGNECILCGQCFVVCPQNAKQIVNEIEKVKVLIQTGDPVYVSLAPSFIANYDGVASRQCARLSKSWASKTLRRLPSAQLTSRTSMSACSRRTAAMLSSPPAAIP